MKVVLALLLLLWPSATAFGAGTLAAQGAARARVGGVVRDEAGAPLARAEVTLARGRATTLRTLTGDDGRFAFEGVGAGEAVLTVGAAGFERQERRLMVSGGGEEVVFVLAPARVSERVTVTATRTETEAGETAASVSVITREQLSTTAALTLDDALRQVPGFQLFRRTGSRAANPTAQGVSLRGTGASGASRALILEDGVALNDPFGGWVYWGRVPRESVERVEVLRGGASHLYGSAAMGGVVQLLTRRAGEEPSLSASASYGTQRGHNASAFAGASRGRWAFTLAGETFNTAGYFLVRPEDRGGADAPASSRHNSLTATVAREVFRNFRLFTRGSYFAEERANGTRLQYNRTHTRQLVVGADFVDGEAGSFSLRAHASAQTFDQTFSAVSAGRDAETLTRLQRVPSQAAGLSLQWSRGFGARHAAVAGFEAREVRGASDEIIYLAGRASSGVGAGGREGSAGVFAEDLFRATDRLTLSAGVRLDRWRNFDAAETVRPLALAGPAATTAFADRSETALSPRASLLYKLSDGAALYASGYRAFRAPTLNELYRDFRVGNVLTLADERLRAERLAGGEAGASFSTRGGRLSARGALFWAEITRPVANVTLSVTPALITRQRHNLGRTRSRGAEMEVEARLTRSWSLAAGYQLTGATVTRSPANPAAEGLSVPQIPRRQLTFRLIYADPRRLTFGLQGRASGSQFDDDLNLFPLAPFLTLDAFASRRLTDAFSLFAAAENLTGHRYEVGRTPVLTVGPPASVRFGFRVNLPAR